MNHGLQIEPIKPEDYVFGNNQLGDSPIQPDANWSGYLPDVEVQNLNGIEPSACVSFATLNIVEILERKLYGGTNNWSDRFLATISGTKERKGNTPGNVANILKEKGCVEESDLPFDSSITTYEAFFAEIKQSLYTLALQFKAEFAFGYEYVKPTYDNLMEALKYSPLGFSVYAWTQDENGLYYRPKEAQDGHYTVCIGYVRNNYWIIFDSYAPSGSAIKHVRWDSLPLVAYRYTLLRQVAVESAWSRFVKLLRSLFEDRAFGATRSPKWREVRNQHIALYPKCAACGTKGRVLKNEVHHKIPVHIDKSKELSSDNLITLCRRCHLLIGHLDSYKSYNSHVVETAIVLLESIKNRP